MKSTYLTAILIAFTLVIAKFVVPANAIKCRTCSEEISCSATQSTADWEMEDCPMNDHNCNLVWHKDNAGKIKLIYGGCSNLLINMCTNDSNGNYVCIANCEGNLCNESIDTSKHYKAPN